MISRRAFIAATCSALIPDVLSAQQPTEPIIDLHQHTNYVGRSDEVLVAHQLAMGIKKTVLLPAGSKYGLAADCGGNDTVMNLARKHPKKFFFFANELPDLPEARPVIEKYLKAGAIGIGEQKFPVDCDSPHIVKIAELAREFDVPILLHFEHKMYNFGLERFHKVLDQFPTVRFIGHAQTWWGNIDRDHDQTVMYPKTKVTPGGITDRLLSDYANMFGDLSAGSGLNALTRDEDFTRDFIARHQDKLVYGSDCSDHVGSGTACQGAQTIAAIRKLSPSKAVERKLLYGNAKKLFRL